MLTKLIVRNFKQFDDVEIELGNPVVFVGPNNSGKTTALQALALWDLGLRRWLEKRGREVSALSRSGVAINRRDLFSIPIPVANLLWRNLKTRDVQRNEGKPETQNVRLEISVEGETEGKTWQCGLEFDYSNSESFYCRSLRTPNGESGERMEIPTQLPVRIALLPPMSGLADREFLKHEGEIGFLIGQGRTAEVLRNLCFKLAEGEGTATHWSDVCTQMQNLFGVKINTPQFIAERSELTLTYKDQNEVELDISSAGRGLHQTLLLLVYMANNPHSVLLLDEPDAHLEILRQRQIYKVLADAAQTYHSQIIMASHSEVILNEAAKRDVVVAFLGRKPRRIDDRGSQLLKSLKEIGWEDYYQAEQTGWVLYLEGSTDLAILQAFAKSLYHPARAALERPFVHYVANSPKNVQSHFFGLREAKENLLGYAVFDRLEKPLHESGEALTMRMWRKREIENYLCQRDTLLGWAGDTESGLFALARKDAMDSAIDALEAGLKVTRKPSPWSDDIKASDEFLDPLFLTLYESMQTPDLVRKSGFHILAPYVAPESIDPEVIEVLNDIVAISEKAQLETSE